jgi:tetratricopeptide (TPR) repeat protein
MKVSLKLFVVIFFLLPFVVPAQQKIDVLILNKEYDKALREIDKQLNEKPSAALYLKKGTIFQSQQNFQNAIAAYLEGLQDEPENVMLMGEAAECFSILGNNHDAVSYYKKASELAPGDLVLAGKLGRVYISLKEYKAAYDVFSSIYTRDSSNVFWNKQLAFCAFQTFRREEAVHLYEKVIESNPRDLGSYLNLISCYNWRKEGNQIISAIQKGLMEFPNDPELIYEQAMYFYKTKRYGPAMVEFEKYAGISKDVDYETLMNYGIATYFAGFEEKALSIFEELFAQNPNDALVIYYKSLCYKKMKNFEEAGKLMQWAIDASTPDYVAEMYHHLGQIYGQLRLFKESIEALQKAVELNPDKVEVFFEIATTYEEFNSNKTLALNYYQIYLKEAGEEGKNIIYALERIEKIKEDLFFDE